MKLQFTVDEIEDAMSATVTRDTRRDAAVAVAEYANARLAEMLAAAPEFTHCYQCAASLKEPRKRLVRVDVEESKP